MQPITSPMTIPLTAGGRSSAMTWLWRHGAPAALTRGGSAVTASGAAPLATGSTGAGVRVEPDATNLVTNPSFEVDTAGWSPSDGGTTATRETEASQVGTACLRIQVNGATTNRGVITSQLPGVTAGVADTLSTWARITSGSAGGRIFIAWYPAASAFISFGEVAVTFGAAWSRHVLTLTAPAGAAKFVVASSTRPRAPTSSARTRYR